MRQLIACLGLFLTACGGGSEEAAEPAPAALPHAQILDGPHPIATITMQDLGEIRIELLPEIAPATVANFTKLANEGFYDGLTFHRVIPDFMIQGGCPNTNNNDPRDDGHGGPGYELPDEFTDYDHARGTLAAANRAAPDTNSGSQFFIVHQDAPELNGRYTAFGRTLSGIETVDAVTALEIDTYGRYGPEDRPYPEDARIERIRVTPAGDGS